MKLTILGAGVRTPYTLHGLVSRGHDLGLTEVVLHDCDHDRLEVMAALGTDLCREWGASFALRAEPSARAALAGARFVFSAIRVGQERARTLDEEIPLRHGVLGQETTGPGGFAMAMRTIPVMLDYGRLMTEVAPGAMMVDFTNPVGIIMQALSDHSPVHAVGICDGPVSMKRSIAEFLRVPGDEIHADYFGLNHCGWIHRVLVDGVDRLPGLLDRYEELQRADDQWRLFDAGLVRSLGMLPMEYLYFYYSRKQAVANIRASGGSRGKQIAELNERLWPVLRERVGSGDIEDARRAWEVAMETRGETYFARERGDTVSSEPIDEPALEDDMFEGEGYEGVATAVMAAALRQRRAPLILNVPNLGAVRDLDDSDVVEVTCMTDQNGARPLAQGRMPRAARDLIGPVKEYERLTVEAAVGGSYPKALAALATHPLVGSNELAKAILDDYLAAPVPLLGRLAR